MRKHKKLLSMLLAFCFLFEAIASSPITVLAQDLNGPAIVSQETEIVNEQDPIDGDKEKDPADATDTTEPTDPVNPTDPTDPVNPTDPVDPVNPTEPTDPENPTEPTEPVDPVNPTDPVDPVNPTDPVDPTNPTDTNETEDTSSDDDGFSTEFVQNEDYHDPVVLPQEALDILAQIEASKNAPLTDEITDLAGDADAIPMLFSSMAAPLAFAPPTFNGPNATVSVENLQKNGVPTGTQLIFYVVTKITGIETIYKQGSRLNVQFYFDDAHMQELSPGLGQYVDYNGFGTSTKISETYVRNAEPGQSYLEVVIEFNQSLISTETHLGSFTMTSQFGIVPDKTIVKAQAMLDLVQIYEGEENHKVVSNEDNIRLVATGQGKINKALIASKLVKELDEHGQPTDKWKKEAVDTVHPGDEISYELTVEVPNTYKVPGSLIVEPYTEFTITEVISKNFKVNGGSGFSLTKADLEAISKDAVNQYVNGPAQVLIIDKDVDLEQIGFSNKATITNNVEVLGVEYRIPSTTELIPVYDPQTGQTKEEAANGRSLMTFRFRTLAYNQDEQVKDQLDVRLRFKVTPKGTKYDNQGPGQRDPSTWEVDETSDELNWPWYYRGRINNTAYANIQYIKENNLITQSNNAPIAIWFNEYPPNGLQEFRLTNPDIINSKTVYDSDLDARGLTYVKGMLGVDEPLTQGYGVIRTNIVNHQAALNHVYQYTSGVNYGHPWYQEENASRQPKSAEYIYTVNSKLDGIGDGLSTPGVGETLIVEYFNISLARKTSNDRYDLEITMMDGTQLSFNDRSFGIVYMDDLRHIDSRLDKSRIRVIKAKVQGIMGDYNFAEDPKDSNGIGNHHVYWAIGVKPIIGNSIYIIETQDLGYSDGNFTNMNIQGAEISEKLTLKERGLHGPSDIKSRELWNFGSISTEKQEVPDPIVGVDARIHRQKSNGFLEVGDNNQLTVTGRVYGMEASANSYFTGSALNGPEFYLGVTLPEMIIPQQNKKNESVWKGTYSDPKRGTLSVDLNLIDIIDNQDKSVTYKLKLDDNRIFELNPGGTLSTTVPVDIIEAYYSVYEINLDSYFTGSGHSIVEGKVATLDSLDQTKNPETVVNKIIKDSEIGLNNVEGSDAVTTRTKYYFEKETHGLHAFMTVRGNLDKNFMRNFGDFENGTGNASTHADGGKALFEMRVKNNGESIFNDFSIITILPNPSDYGVSDKLARETAFTTTLESVTFGNAITGKFWYSTSDLPLNLVAENLRFDGTDLSGNDPAWKGVNGATGGDGLVSFNQIPKADLDKITALKFEFDKSIELHNNNEELVLANYGVNVGPDAKEGDMLWNSFVVNAFSSNLELNEKTLSIEAVKVGAKITNAPPPPFEKKVNDYFEYSILNRSEEFVYSLELKVPGADENQEKYKSLKMIDNMEPVLELIDDSTLHPIYVTVDNTVVPISELEAMGVVFDSYRNDSKNVVNWISMELPEGPESEPDATVKKFAGKTIKLYFTAKVKETWSIKELLDNYGQNRNHIENTATLEVNGNPQPSNTVIVKVPTQPTIDKKVYGQDIHYLLNKKDDIKYTIRLAFPKNMSSFDTLTVTDVLEPALQLKTNGNKLYDYSAIIEKAAGTTENITDVGDVYVNLNGSKEGQSSFRYTLLGNQINLDRLRGNTLVLTFYANVKASWTDEELLEKYGVGVDDKVQIPNTAKLVFDGSPADSNTVIVEPSEGPQVVKSVNTIGQTSFQITETDMNQSFKYFIDVKFPAEYSGYETIRLIDELDLPLSFDVNSIKVGLYRPDGSLIENIYDHSITSLKESVNSTLRYDQSEAETGSNKIDYTLNAIYGYNKLNGNILRMEFNAHIKSVWRNFDKIKAHVDNDKAEIPNTATLKYKKGDTPDETDITTPPVVVIPPTPSGPITKPEIRKTISAVGGTEGVRLELGQGHRYDEFIFRVRVTMPEKRVGVNFADVKVYDQINKLLEVTGYDMYMGSIKITNNAEYGRFTKTGTDINNDVEYSFNNSKVTASPDGIIGKELIMVIKAKIKDGVTDDMILAQRAQLEIPNEAFIKYKTVTGPAGIENQPINPSNPGGGVSVGPEEEGKSNEVVVVPPNEKPVIKKDVNGKEDIKLADGQRDSVFTYNINAVIPNRSDLRTYVVSDLISNALEVQSIDVKMEGVTGNIGTYVADPESIESNMGQLTVEAVSPDADDVIQKNYTQIKHSFGAGFDFGPYKGKTVTLEIKAKFRADVTDAEIFAKYEGTMKTPNTAVVEVNDKPTSSDTVYVTPPDPEDPDPEVKKEIKATEDGNWANKEELLRRDQVFTYRVSATVKAGTNLKSLVIQDTLVDVLSYKANTAKVVYGDADNMSAAADAIATNMGTLTTDGNVIRFVFDDSKITETLAKDKKVILEFDAIINPKATDEQLAKYISDVSDKVEIPNTGVLNLNDHPYNSNEVFVIPPDKPDIEKSVEKQGKENTVVNLTDEFDFFVDINVPDNDDVYTALGFTDELDDVLELLPESVVIKLRDNSNNQVTTIYENRTPVGDGVGKIRVSASVNSNKGVQNKITFAWRNDFNFAKGKTIEASFKVKVKEAYMKKDGDNWVASDELEAYLEKIGGALENKAALQFNNDPDKYSNTTTIRLEEGIVKKISRYGSVEETEDLKLNDRDEMFTFRLRAALPDGTDGTVKNITIYDKLEDFLQVKENGVRAYWSHEGGSIDISSSHGRFTHDGTVNNEVIFAVDNSKLPELLGETIVIEIDAFIRAGVTNDQIRDKYDELKIPNTGYLKYVKDDKPVETPTDEVHVTPPDPEIDKSIKTSTGSANEIELVNKKQSFKFLVSTYLPQDRTIQSFVIKDKIENALLVEKVELYFDGSLRGEFTTAGTHEVAGLGSLIIAPENPIITDIIQEDYTNIEFSFADDFSYSQNKGKQIRLEITSKINDNVTNADLLEKYGKLEVTNKAYLYINNEPSWSDEVKVIPPGDPEIYKKIKVDGQEEDHYDLGKRDETVVYRVKAIMPLNMEDISDVEIRDVLEPVLKYTLGTSKLLISGNEVDSRLYGRFVYSDTANSVSFVFTSGRDYSDVAGKEVTMEFGARIRSEITDDQFGAYQEIDGDKTVVKIPNRGQLIIDGKDPIFSDKVTITPPGDPVTKTVEGRDPESKTWHYVIKPGEQYFTFRISTTVPSNYVAKGFETVTLSDTLEKVLEVAYEGTDAGVDYGNGVRIKIGGVEYDVLELAKNGSVYGRLFVDGYRVDYKDGSLQKVETINRDEIWTPVTPQDIWQSEDGIGKSIKFVFNTDGMAKSQDDDGKIELVIDSRIRLDATDEDLEPYGYVFENTGKLNINDNPAIDSNTVDVRPPEDPKIGKTVNNVNIYELVDWDEVFTYRINILIDKSVAHYDKLIVTDQLESWLKFVGEPVIKSDNQILANFGRKLAGDNAKQLKYEFSKANGDDFTDIAGTTLTIEFNAAIDADTFEQRQQLLDHYAKVEVGTEGKIPNKAKLEFNDNDPVWSGTVYVTPPPAIDKDVNGKELEIVNLKDSFTFNVAIAVADNEVEYSMIGFTDKLEWPLITSKSDFTVKVDGDVITSNYKLDVTRDRNDRRYNINFEITDKSYIESLRGKTIVVSFVTRINPEFIGADGKPNVDLAKYLEDNGGIVNIANLKFNNNDQIKTKPVVVIPEVETPLIRKRVNGEEHIDLKSMTEKFTYTVSVTLPKDEEELLKDFVITDTFVEHIKADPSTYSISVIDGTSISNVFTEADDDGFVYTISDTDLANLRGKVVTISVIASIRDGYTMDDIKEAYSDLKIPNTAKLEYNIVTPGEDGNPPTTEPADPIETPPVTVKPPLEKPEPGKEVYNLDENGNIIDPQESGGKYKINIKGRDEEFVFKVNTNLVSHINGQKVTEITIKDKVPQVLDIIDVYVTVGGDDKAHVVGSTAGILNKNTDGIRNYVTFAFKDTYISALADIITNNGKDSTEELDENKAVMTIKAKIGADVTDKQLEEMFGGVAVNNEASVSFNDEEIPTNKVTVIPPPESKLPTITKQILDKNNNEFLKMLLEKRDSLIRYQVKVNIFDKVAGYKSLRIYDELEDVLTIPADHHNATIEINGAIYNLSNAVTNPADPKTVGTYRIYETSTGKSAIEFVFADGFDYSTIASSTIVMRFNARIKPGVTDSQLIAKYEGTTEIPNIANVEYNKGEDDEKDIPSNPVIVQPPVGVPEVDKFVNEGKKGDTIKLENRFEIFEFRIATRIPVPNTSEDDYEQVRLYEFFIEDTIEPVLEFVGSPDLFVNGVSINTDSQLYDNVVGADSDPKKGGFSNPNEQTLRFTFRENCDYTSIYGAPVNLVFKARIKRGVSDETLEQYIVKGGIPNTGRIQVNGVPNESNPVFVNPPDLPSPSIEKYVNGKTSHTVQLINEVFNYTIEVDMPYTDMLEGVTKLQITDELEHVLEVASGKDDIKVELIEYPRDSNGNKSGPGVKKNIKSWGVLTLSNSGVKQVVDFTFVSENSAVVNPTKIESTSGNTILITIPAKIKDAYTAADISRLYSGGIPNHATLNFAYNDPKDTDDVHVFPPGPRPNTIQRPEVQKYVGLFAEEDDVLKNLPSMYREFEYHIDIRLPGSTYGYEQLKLVDTLDDYLEITSKPPTFVTKGSTNIIDLLDGNRFGELDISGNTVTYTFNSDTLENTELSGRVLRLTVYAKIKAPTDGKTDAQLLKEIQNKYWDNNAYERNPGYIPNKAELYFLGKGLSEDLIESQTVYVKPPTDLPVDIIDNEKTVNGSKDPLTLKVRDEVFTYEVKVKIDDDVSDYETLFIRDNVPSVLQIEETPSVTIDGESMIGKDKTLWRYDVNDNYMEFRFIKDFDFESIKGKTVVMTIKAKIKPSVSDEEIIRLYGSLDIPNTGEIVFNGDVSSTNTVIVTPPSDPDRPISPPIEKTVNGNTGSVSIDRDEVFTYNVAVQLPANTRGYQSLEIRDTLESVLEIEGIWIRINGTTYVAGDATEFGRLEQNGQTVSFVFNDGFNFNSIAGQLVELIIDAKIRDDVTSAQLVELYGSEMEIPNRASLIFNNTSEDSNTVWVKPDTTTPNPGPDPDPDPDPNPDPDPEDPIIIPNVPTPYGVIDNGDGTYTILDEDGTPLGYTTKNPNEESIYLDDIIPLGGVKINPKTGINTSIDFILFIISAIIMLIISKAYKMAIMMREASMVSVAANISNNRYAYSENDDESGKDFKEKLLYRFTKAKNPRWDKDYRYRK